MLRRALLLALVATCAAGGVAAQIPCHQATISVDPSPATSGGILIRRLLTSDTYAGVSVSRAEQIIDVRADVHCYPGLPPGPTAKEVALEPLLAGEYTLRYFVRTSTGSAGWSAEALSATTSLSVPQASPPAAKRLKRLSGDRQIIHEGRMPEPLRARVVESADLPMVGARVAFGPTDLSNRPMPTSSRTRPTFGA